MGEPVADRTARIERLVRLRQEAQRIVAELFGAEEQASAGDAGPRVPVDVYEDREAFRLTFEVPGVVPDDLSLFVQGSSLVVEGQKQLPTEDRVSFECAERAYGGFRRVVELPGAADTSRIEARLDGGVLSVTLPRIRERRGRRREVSIG